MAKKCQGLCRWVVVSLLFVIVSCASFKPANLDPSTGKFPAWTKVHERYINIFRPLAGVKEARYVYLRTYAKYGDDRFYDFVKDALIKIGFPKVYSKKELYEMISQSGLSPYIKSLSDPISLHNLAKVTGPFIVLVCSVFPVSDTVFRFDVQLIEPLSGDIYLEISRIRINFADMDREINYPILNVIKQWYDESAKLPYEKPKEKPTNERTI